MKIETHWSVSVHSSEDGLSYTETIDSYRVNVSHQIFNGVPHRVFIGNVIDFAFIPAYLLFHNPDGTKNEILYYHLNSDRKSMTFYSQVHQFSIR